MSIVSTSTGATMRQARFDQRVRCCALDADGGRLLIGTFGRTAGARAAPAALACPSLAHASLSPRAQPRVF